MSSELKWPTVKAGILDRGYDLLDLESDASTLLG